MYYIWLALVSIGYPAKKLGTEDRHKIEHVHYGRWMGAKKEENRKEK